MQVSVTVITRNEESGIRSMLESVRWAEEIVVVDCGSTDQTVRIAEDCGAKVLHHDFESFSAQKNFAQEHAHRDWILNLDADEICPPELASEIQALPEDGPVGYYIPRRNYFQNRWIRRCGWFPDYKLRLYRKREGRWVGRVHESVRLSQSDRLPKLRTPMEHYTYKGFERYLGSVQQYAHLAAEQMKEEGRTAGVLDIFFRPPVAFIKKYFLQLGLLDGRPGFVISMLTAYGIFLRYTFLSEMTRSRKS